jgi:hypothetical protein
LRLRRKKLEEPLNELNPVSQELQKTTVEQKFNATAIL